MPRTKLKKTAPTSKRNRNSRTEEFRVNAVAELEGGKTNFIYFLCNFFAFQLIKSHFL